MTCTVTDTRLVFRFADGAVTEAPAHLLAHSKILQKSFNVADGAEFGVVVPEGFLESWLQLVHHDGEQVPVDALLKGFKVQPLR